MKVFADPQKPKDLDKLLATLPKGAKPVSRHIVTGGDLHAARQDATAVFLNVDDNATVEKVHIGIPSEPDDFVQEQFQLGTREAWNSTWTRKSRTRKSRT